MKRIYFILLLCAVFVGVSLSQTITPSQILKNMKAQFNKVNDYTADIEANVKLEMLKMPKVRLKVFFKQPDKFHYESKNFAMLPKGGVNFNPLDFPEDKYSYKLNGKETINNTPVYALELTPKETKNDTKKDTKKEVLPTKTYIWVDADNWVAKRVVNEKDETYKIIIDFNHSWIDGKYYMTSWIKIAYEVKNLPEGSETKPKNKHSRNLKVQNGEITMNLLNYVINSGLSDEIFKKENGK